eukprot:3936604-Pyramimonas_sp.AAC.1
MLEKFLNLIQRPARVFRRFNRLPMDCVVAIDQGTQSSRVIFYNVKDMRAVASHQLEHTQIRPKPGCVPE